VGCQIGANFFDEHLAIMEPRGSISEDGLPRGTATLIDCRPAKAWSIQIYHVLNKSAVKIMQCLQRVF
jgi:hypothetical protein